MHASPTGSFDSNPLFSPFSFSCFILYNGCSIPLPSPQRIQGREGGKETVLLIAITTSGKSPNIIEALKKAKSLGVKTVGLTGNTGGDLPELSDILLVVPSKTTSRIQEMHIMLGQMLCGALEYKMGLIEG